MKIPWYQRASFWNLVTHSVQIALGAAQGITLAAEVQHVWNFIMAGIQAALGIMSLWTADKNANNIIDIAEEMTDVTITSNKPINVINETPNE